VPNANVPIKNHLLASVQEPLQQIPQLLNRPGRSRYHNPPFFPAFFIERNAHTIMPSINQIAQPTQHLLKHLFPIPTNQIINICKNTTEIRKETYHILSAKIVNKSHRLGNEEIEGF
jgi:hypothetical protein